MDYTAGKCLVLCRYIDELAVQTLPIKVRAPARYFSNGIPTQFGKVFHPNMRQKLVRKQTATGRYIKQDVMHYKIQIPTKGEMVRFHEPNL